MDNAFHFSAFGIFAQGVVIQAAFEFDDVAGGVFHHFVALHHIAVAQAHFAAKGQAFPAFGRVFAEIVGFDVERGRNRQFAAAMSSRFG